MGRLFCASASWGQLHCAGLHAGRLGLALRMWTGWLNLEQRRLAFQRAVWGRALFDAGSFGSGWLPTANTQVQGGENFMDFVFVGTKFG